MQKTVSTELTQASKEFMQEKSVNRDHLVNKRKLDGISVDQAHSVTKGFLQVWSVNRASVG